MNLRVRECAYPPDRSAQRPSSDRVHIRNWITEYMRQQRSRWIRINYSSRVHARDRNKDLYVDILLVSYGEHELQRHLHKQHTPSTVIRGDSDSYIFFGSSSRLLFGHFRGTLKLFVCVCAREWT